MLNFFRRFFLIFFPLKNFLWNSKNSLKNIQHSNEYEEEFFYITELKRTETLHKIVPKTKKWEWNDENVFWWNYWRKISNFWRFLFQSARLNLEFKDITFSSQFSYLNPPKSALSFLIHINSHQYPNKIHLGWKFIKNLIFSLGRDFFFCVCMSVRHKNKKQKHNKVPLFYLLYGGMSSYFTLCILLCFTLIHTQRYVPIARTRLALFKELRYGIWMYVIP